MHAGRRAVQQAADAVDEPGLLLHADERQPEAELGERAIAVDDGLEEVRRQEPQHPPHPRGRQLLRRRAVGEDLGEVGPGPQPRVEGEHALLQLGEEAQHAGLRDVARADGHAESVARPQRPLKVLDGAQLPHAGRREPRHVRLDRRAGAHRETGARRHGQQRDDRGPQPERAQPARQRRGERPGGPAVEADEQRRADGERARQPGRDPEGKRGPEAVEQRSPAEAQDEEPERGQRAGQRERRPDGGRGAGDRGARRVARGPRRPVARLELDGVVQRQPEDDRQRRDGRRREAEPQDRAEPDGHHRRRAGGTKRRDALRPPADDEQQREHGQRRQRGQDEQLAPHLALERGRDERAAGDGDAHAGQVGPARQALDARAEVEHALAADTGLGAHDDDGVVAVREQPAEAALGLGAGAEDQRRDERAVRHRRRPGEPEAHEEIRVLARRAPQPAPAATRGGAQLGADDAVGLHHRLVDEGSRPVDGPDARQARELALQAGERHEVAQGERTAEVAVDRDVDRIGAEVLAQRGVRSPDIRVAARQEVARRVGPQPARERHRGQHGGERDREREPGTGAREHGGAGATHP